jgi:riboflavin biosynthesis pyrimidine reductase
LESTGARLIALPGAATERFPPEQLLSSLAGLGITSVLLEGGAGLYAPFLEAALVDRLHLFQAAKLFGGADALSLTPAKLPLPLEAKGSVRITALGDDWVVETRFASFLHSGL